MLKDYISVNEAAKIAGVSDRMVRYWIAKKAIVAHKITDYFWTVSKKSLESFLRKRDGL